MESNITETTTTTHIGEDLSSCSSPILPDDNPLKQEIKLSYHLTPESQSGSKGLQAMTILCKRCHRQELQILASPPDEDDPCFTRIPKNSKEGDGENETPWYLKEDTKDQSSFSRRKKYAASSREQSKCIPVTGPVTEYKDAYRNPDDPSPKSHSDRPQFQPVQRPKKRPPWNPSIHVPPPPFQETLDAIEAKLKVLDEAEDPPPDVMAAVIQRQNLREKYRQKRNEGGGGECGVCNDNDDASPKDSEIPSPWGWLAPQNQPRVFVQGSHLELLEDESLLSDV